MDSDHKCQCSGPIYQTAFNRRSFIQVGVLGGLGLSLVDLFAPPAFASEGRVSGPAKSVIQIIFPGGLAHQES